MTRDRRQSTVLPHQASDDSTEAHGARTTLATIASQAGVSTATVSKVLNGRADVASTTRARVQRLLTAQKYSPPQRSSAVVDLVFSGLDSPWAVEILRGVESYFTRRARAVAVSAVEGHGPALPPSWAGALARHHSAGVLLVMSQLTPRQWRELQDKSIPLVVIDPADTPGSEVASVGATNWSGGIAATEHLLELGHRRIAVISGPETYLCSRARVDGYRHALDQARRPFDASLVRWGRFRHESGFQAAMELFDHPGRPTAIFAGSDEQALGVYEAARQRGMSIPHDLSVVGFDDLPLARWLPPPLTTVRQPLAEMGVMAAEMLTRLIEGHALPSRRVELATELVVRDSTAPPGPS